MPICSFLGRLFVKPDWKARFHPQDHKVTDRTGDVFNTSIDFGDGKKGEEMCTAILDPKSGEYVLTCQIQASRKSVTSLQSAADVEQSKGLLHHISIVRCDMLASNTPPRVSEGENTIISPALFVFFGTCVRLEKKKRGCDSQ